MADINDCIEAIADIAAEWRDPEHPGRQTAVEETLAAPNRWTEPALEHILNRWMQRLTVDRLSEWLGGPPPQINDPVGVIHPETGPLAGFRDALACWALGGPYVGAVPAASPALLRAFGGAVKKRAGIQMQFAEPDVVYEDGEALLAQPGEDEARIHDTCDEHGIPPARRHIRSPVYSIGLVDGHESADEKGRLAEDMLLFEGMGRRRLAILWAPADHSPDAYLEAMAHFRGLFPTHEDTPGTLQMQQAFLEARDEPHAYADGLEFLVSRGDPEPQRPGHVRWSEYESLADVDEWLVEHRDQVYSVVARPQLHDQCPDGWRMRSPGGVHIPPLDDPEGQATVAFLRDLST